MKWRIPVLIAGALCSVLAMVSCNSNDVFGPSGPGMTALPAGADAVRGGLMYDKWWAVTGAPTPTGDHPAYPPGGPRSGDTTWRCKECHGWDYLGVDGAYATGSHFTGIQGVLHARGSDPGALFNALKVSPLHDFSAEMTDAELWDLAAFLKQGMLDMRNHIDYATKAALGNAANGQGLYAGAGRCAMCHGADGRDIDFGGEFLGDLARGNPWETLHKIRWGHPGSGMPSAVANGLSASEHVDILTYTQTLP
jgi:thiosulfate dehydrogenase